MYRGPQKFSIASHVNQLYHQQRYFNQFGKTVYQTHKHPITESDKKLRIGGTPHKEKVELSI